MQSSNLFVALIVTLFLPNIQFGAKFNYMQWTSEKCLSEDRKSNPRNSLWQAGLFRFQVQEWTKTLQNLSKIRLRIDFVPEETFRDTKTTTWIGKHVPISVSVSSNLVEEPIFLCNSDPRHRVAFFIGALEKSASQSKAKKKTYSMISRQQ